MNENKIREIVHSAIHDEVDLDPSLSNFVAEF